MVDPASGPATDAALPVAGWVLSGGQGQRMGGQDKGLLPWRGQPLAWQVATQLAPQVQALTINANRHLTDYGAWPWPVCPDDADLPAASGPLMGMLTGLRRHPAAWLQVVPCDGPHLPPDLVARLRGAALAAGAEAAVPYTDLAGEVGAGSRQHHWTCALLHPNARDSLEALVHTPERRVRAWLTQMRWIGVCFVRADAFININTPETWHAHSQPPG